MKKISLLIVVAAIVAISLFTSVPVFAEEMDTTYEDTTETIADTTEEAESTASEDVETDVGVETAPTSKEPTEQANTLVSRLQEAWESGDIMDIVVIVWGVVCAVFMLVLKNADKVSTIAIRADLKNTSKSTTEKMNELVSAQNDVTENLKALGYAFEKLYQDTNASIDAVKLSDDKQIQDLTAKINACGDAIIAFASMMQVVYSNSKTIPQSTKDIVNEDFLKVVHSFKSLQEGNDE